MNAKNIFFVGNLMFFWFAKGGDLCLCRFFQMKSLSYSFRFWAHVMMAYVFTFWTFYILYKEYKTISTMRLHFLASENRRPDQFTVGAIRILLTINVTSVYTYNVWSVTDSDSSHRSLLKMSHQILMNQWTSTLNISSAWIIQIIICHIRFVLY